jgi:hypothetical protein
MSDFITVTELGDYLSRDLSADDGAALAVTMACDTVRMITEQDFTPLTSETIRLDGTGTDTLLLPQAPVSAAGTVVVNGGTLDNNEYTLRADGALIRIYTGTDGTATWSSWATSPCSYWPQGRQNVSVTYDHGYAAGTLVPDDVRMVAMMIASRLAVQGVDQSRRVGQSQVTYAVSSTDLTAGEKAILRKYKRSL